MKSLRIFHRAVRAAHRRGSTRRSSDARPSLEALEGRWLLSYSVTDLGTLGGGYSNANDINASGQVVGWSDLSSGSERAFLWRNGVMTNLGTLGGYFSTARGINDAGKVVGESTTVDGTVHAFLLAPEDTDGNGAPDRWFRDSNNDGKNDLMLDLGPDSAAYDVNNAGQVVGTHWNGPSPYDSERAFRWQNGIMTDLGTLAGPSNATAINDIGQVTGAFRTATGESAFLWQSGVMHDLGMSNGGFDINQSGQVAGGGGYLDYASLWTPTTPNGTAGSITSLGALPPDFVDPRESVSTYSTAAGINDFGTVVGDSYTIHSYADPDGGYYNENSRVFVWAGGVMHDLWQEGVGLQDARAINNAGQIVGNGLFTVFGGGSTGHGVILTPESHAKSWVGPASGGNWSTASNWSPSGVPTASDAVTISGKSVTLNASATVASLNLTGGASLGLAANGARVLRAASLSITSTSKLDLNDNGLILDYTGASPVSTVRSALNSGYASAAWNGVGIDSSTAASMSRTGLGFAESSELYSSFPATFLGQSVDNTSVVLRYTLLGDANLDGKIDTRDFNALASNFGGSSRTWTQADFNFDTIIDTLDFNALASNFGNSLAETSASATALVQTSLASQVLWSDQRIDGDNIDSEPAA